VAEHRRSTEDLQRRLEDWPKGSVPEGVKFLTAAVDVQAARFVVHVFGWGVGLESWLIARFTISSSLRPEEDRTAALEPSAYLEDWDLITEQVIERSYAGMVPRLVMCDSGGKIGVTAKAYAFFRWLRRRGMHKRFRLVKGASRLDAPTATLTWPDASDRKDRKQGGRGDVPVWLINTNVLKDAVVGDLARTEYGPGYVHVPRWVDEEFFAELAAETRTEKGWRNANREPNEAFDLHVYNRAACRVLKADRIDWDRPPVWARPPAADASVPAEPVSDSEGDDLAPKAASFARKPSNFRRGWFKK
jgi:phage terminase large subunit GpA-like protein